MYRKTLWAAALAVCISMTTAENSTNTIKQSAGNKLNCMTRRCVMDNLEFGRNT